jgi:hypothetical protein
MLPGKGMHTCISHLNISYGSLILSLLMLNAYCIYGLQNRIFKKQHKALNEACNLQLLCVRCICTLCSFPHCIRGFVYIF